MQSSYNVLVAVQAPTQRAPPLSDHCQEDVLLAPLLAALAHLLLPKLLSSD